MVFYHISGTSVISQTKGKRNEKGYEPRTFDGNVETTTKLRSLEFSAYP